MRPRNSDEIHCEHQDFRLPMLLEFLVPLLGVMLSTPRVFGQGAPIDSISLSTLYGYTENYSPVSGLEVLGWPQFFYLQGGGGWPFGAGTTQVNSGVQTSVSVAGSLISYSLSPPPGSLIYSHTDYDNGSASTNGQLVSTAPLTLTAYSGSDTATLTGYAMITVDQPANYGGDLFHYFDAPIGAYVPFSLTYTLTSGTWSPTTMASNFSYNLSGTLDFTKAVPEPSSSLIPVSAVALASFRRRRKVVHHLQVT